MHHSERRTATLDEAYPFLRRYQVRKIHETPIALLEDYIRRGIIEKEPDGKYTFGHLTHQKFLAALWLCEKNPVDFIWSKLKSPWWAKVQEFYAAKKLDITDLVRFGSSLREIAKS